MANLTQVTDKLADGQVDIYEILGRFFNRFQGLYEIIGSLALVTDQLEQAVGENPNKQQYDAIYAKIETLRNSAVTEEQNLQNAINEATIDAAKLAGMAATPFDQPPAVPPAA